MELNKKDLKKITLDFLGLSSRLLQADFRDYNTVLSRFIRFIRDTEIINDYIQDCGACELDLDMEFKAVRSSQYTFDLGDTDQEEVRNITAILQYIIDKKISVACDVGFSYSSSNKYQDSLKAFNDRVVVILINHIENYLTKIGIDMGMNEQTIFNTSVHNGQINIVNNSGVINTNTVIDSNDLNRIDRLINAIITESQKCDLSNDDEDIIKNSIEVIEEESKADNPRTSIIKVAINGLKTIKGSVEFAAAVAQLADFIIPLIS